MRFVSAPAGGFRLYAVTGTNTVSFAADFSDADTAGLLGFAVEREEIASGHRAYLPGMKVFRSVLPHPTATTEVSTEDHPVQSFVWDDFTAAPEQHYRYWFHPLKGRPSALDRSAPAIELAVETEAHGDAVHDIYFNRGVASSQAYAKEFKNQAPASITDPAERRRAYAWLSRGLEEALLGFVNEVPKGDTLLGCFYEFTYRPFADALKAAIDRGVTVKLIIDGKPGDDMPGPASHAQVAAAGIEAAVALWRTHNPSDIQHNKFMVRLAGGDTPAEVWTGSTNITESGIFGQTNVGHRVRDAATAEIYRRYWDAMLPDPGSAQGDDRATSTAAKAAWRKTVMALQAVPTKWLDVAPGITPVFSPRSGTTVLDMYVAALDEAQSLACVTLAFGVNKEFKARLADNNSTSAVTFLLLERQDLPNPQAKDPFVPLRARNNVYEAWGAYLEDPVYQWTRETNSHELGITTYVTYIHSKFLLHDPLGADPIVITGSANFSEDSTTGNDENMLLIRGDQRVADIYFTEFNRLFFHYYFRSVFEQLHRHQTPVGNGDDPSTSLFLREDDSWLDAYGSNSLRTKRVRVFTTMAGATPG